MIQQREWRWWSIVLRGLVAVVFGLLSLFAPAAAFVSLVFLFGVFVLVDGVFALALVKQPSRLSRRAVIARGAVSIVAGVITLMWPDISALALLIVIGVWAIAGGLLEVATAIRMRDEIEHDWLLGVEGVLSVGFGIALLISPLAGAIVLGLWVGAYALALGIALLFTGFKLRSHMQRMMPGRARLIDVG
jgi:uncharacterized membrane protein HdeD (DUF308 family)